MTPMVARWMRAGGMTAKSEFVTPWGVCDLVGLRFNAENLACCASSCSRRAR